MFDVVTIGSATRDNFLRADFETIPWKKTPSGKAYALPLGGKLEVKGAVLTIGGNSANASVTFARQGFKAACAAKIGCDLAGEALKQQLGHEKVNTSEIVCTPDLPTAYSVLLLQGGPPRKTSSRGKPRGREATLRGERTILGYHGAADSFTLRDLKLPQLRAGWWYMSLAGESHRMLTPLLRFARRNNIAVAFNPSGHHLRHKRREVLSSLRDLSFLAVNDEEASLITGIPWRREQAVFKKLDKLTPGILAVTEGPKGVTVSDGRYIYRASIFKERKLVDRTGAGDAFGSGFVAGLMRRGVNLKNLGRAKPDDICHAIRLATANATSVVEQIGATEGVLTKKDFDKNPRWRNLKIAIQKL